MATVEITRQSALPTPSAAPSSLRAPDVAPVHLGYIDSLRGWAFLLVLLVHAANMVPLPDGGVLRRVTSCGSFGVQLFFVISALTLILSADARRSRDRRPTLAFFARRFFRIAPLFWLMVLANFWLYGHSLRGHAPLGVGRRQTVLQLVFLHGWVPDAINAPVVGGWSVGVEMMFYLAFPLLYRLRSPRGSLAFLAGSLAFVGACDYWDVAARLHPAWAAAFPGHIASYLYFWPPAQLPVFALGFVLYNLIRGTARDGSGAVRVERGALVAALAALTLAVATAEPERSKTTALPGHIRAAVGFCLLVWWLSLSPPRLIVNGVTRRIGTLSYSAYLTH